MATVQQRAAHDAYGKELLRRALGSRVDFSAESRCVPYGECRGFVDGTIDGRIAVEIEACNDKQIRAAVLNLALHPFPHKLLLIMSSNTNASNAKKMAEHILPRLGIDPGAFEVACLGGSGKGTAYEADAAVVRAATQRLGVTL